MNKLQRNLLKGLSLLSIALLASCGGGGGGGAAPATGPISGTFVDSEVGNIGFRTATQEGMTTTDGVFWFEPGETITFFIGDLELPAADAKRVMSPLDLVGTDDITDQSVVNIIRLLQSLDIDDDTSNGIVIPDDAAAAAGATNFDVPVDDFGNRSEIINLLSNGGGPNTELVSADAALAHFADTAAFFEAGPFTASYFNNQVPAGTESVDRPALNYTSDSFMGIPSDSLSANWEGTLRVGYLPQTIDINIDIAFGSARLFIDEEEVSLSGQPQTVSRFFDVATNEIAEYAIRVEFDNDTFTTGFNTSFSSDLQLTRSEADTYLDELIDSQTQLIYVGAYESSDIGNTATVTLGNSADKVYLFLSSYRAINWIIDNPNSVEIAGIAHNSVDNGSNVSTGYVEDIINITDFRFGYEDFSEPESDIFAVAERFPTLSTGTYSISEVVIDTQ